MQYRIAVIGANEPLGREVLRTLAEREFPAREVLALGNGRAAGQEISYGEDKILKLRSIEGFTGEGYDLVFAVPGKGFAAVAARAAAAGALVIDCGAEHRLSLGVPLVVPEANARALASIKRHIVANPSPAAIALATALTPLHARAKVLRVVACVHLPVSEAGKAAMDELFNQSRAVFVNDPSVPEQFPKPIAYNLIPQVERIEPDGETAVEHALGLELRKILDPDLRVAATFLRAPVFIGLGIALHAEFEHAISPAEASGMLRDAPGLQLVDRREDGGYVTPLESAGEDAVYVGRLRRDGSVPHGLALWLTTDNLRKGGALNGVQIAEILHAEGRLGKPPG